MFVLLDCTVVKAKKNGRCWMHRPTEENPGQLERITGSLL